MPVRPVQAPASPASGSASRRWTARFRPAPPRRARSPSPPGCRGRGSPDGGACHHVSVSEGGDGETPLRVLLVHDDALARGGLAGYLHAADGIDVVAEAADGDEVVELVHRHLPHVVLMDVRMHRMDGIRATAAATALARPPRVLMLTTFDLDEYVFASLEAGASGFLLKDASP